MKELIRKITAKPWVAHLLRTVERFGNRLGSQFAAAITYFSVLALVPILLFAFAAAGFVLTVARPELLTPIAQAAAQAAGGNDPATQQKILAVVTDALGNWRGVGIVALLSAVYSGAGWMSNLKNAVRAQWRPDFDLQESGGNIVKVTLVNLATLVGLVLLIAITFGLASVSTTLTDEVLKLLGLSSVSALRPVLQFAPVIFSIGAGWLLFMYLFTLLPETREPWSVVRRGALLGAVGLGVLQYLTGFLFGLFARNRAASIFGPVIALMLFFNVFAQLILFCAAWIATARHEAIAKSEPVVRFPLTPTSEIDPAGADSIRAVEADRPPEPGPGWAYLPGVATGVGIGAVVAWWTARRR